MRVLLPACVVVALACSGLPTAERPVPRAEARPGVPVAATGLQEPLSYADFFLILPAGADRTAAETALRSAVEARRIPLVAERGGATGLTAVTGWSAVAGSEFDPAMLPYFGRGLSEADVVGLGAATELVSVSVAGPIAQAAEVQHAGAELVASAAEASNAWIHDAFTAETFTRASFAEARPPGFSLDVQRLAVLHAVRADDGMLFLESRGLGRFGLPEVILRHVPSAYLGAMTDLVNAAGQTLVERGALTGEGALAVDLATLRTDPWPARGAEIAAAGGLGDDHPRRALDGVRSARGTAPRGAAPPWGGRRHRARGGGGAGIRRGRRRPLRRRTRRPRARSGPKSRSRSALGAAAPLRGRGP